MAASILTMGSISQSVFSAHMALCSQLRVIECVVSTERDHLIITHYQQLYESDIYAGNASI